MLDGEDCMRKLCNLIATEPVPNPCYTRHCTINSQPSTEPVFNSSNNKHCTVNHQLSTGLVPKH